MLREAEGPVDLEGVRVYLHPKVYKPAEDTFILLKLIPEVSKGKRVLDLGCGVGVLGLKALLEGAKEALMVDLNPHAVELSRVNARLNRVHSKTTIFQSNLLTPLRTLNCIDLIIFNPPYLPGDVWRDWLDYSWHGGKRGVEVFLEFTAQLEALEYTGDLLFTALKTREWRKALRAVEELNFKIERVGFTHKFFETIEAYYGVRVEKHQ